MNTRIVIALAISAVLVGWSFWLVSEKSATVGVPTLVPAAVSVVDGVQIIDISAKGGYSPREVVAAAGMPTILRVRTSGTFDCSASLVIPDLSYQKFLQASGTEDIPISAEQAQGTLQGLCSMGMYGFQIKFQ